MAPTEKQQSIVLLLWHFFRDLRTLSVEVSRFHTLMETLSITDLETLSGKLTNETCGGASTMDPTETGNGHVTPMEPSDPSIFRSEELEEERWEFAHTMGAHIDDCSHYAVLGEHQPALVTEAWSRFWPSDVTYYLGEALHMIARIGTKGKALRDLRKARWCIEQAIRVLEK